MAYCTISQVDRVLAQTLTTGAPDTLLTPGAMTAIGNTRRPNSIPQSDIEYYIRLSDSHINAALSQQYTTPIPELCDFDTTLTADIDEYTDGFTLTSWAVIAVGDQLILHDGDVTERIEVESVDASTGEILAVSPPTNVFASANTRVMRVRFPDPITFVSARLTAAAVYDRYAKAQQEPGKSEYADILRQEAINELNNVREGRTILHGVRRIGWRFANPTLLDRYPLKGTFESDGTRSDQGK